MRIAVLFLTFGLILVATSAESAESSSRELYSQTVDKAIRFLKSNGQAADGSYTSGAGPGVTAIVTTGILRNGYSANDPLVDKSLRYLKGFVQPNGGIYAKDSVYRNYETCLSIMCFVEADRQRPGRHSKLIEAAQRFVKGIQNDEGEGHDASSPAHGGTGYGKHKRPDLSNTSFLIEALKASGNDENSDAVKKALLFVSRCQNLESEHTTTPSPSKNPDGGFY